LARIDPMHSQIDLQALNELLAAAEAGGEISPAKYAALLMCDVNEVEQQARARRRSVSLEAGVDPVQDYLRDALRVIRALLREAPDAAQALRWFRDLPLDEFPYKTPEMLVAEGRASVLLRKL
jgi:hypothetical protein